MFWKDDEGDEQLAENLNRIVDAMAERRTLFRLLLIFGTINLLIWLSVVIFPTHVRDAFILINGVSEKISKATLAVPFAFGLFFAYSLFRLKFPEIEEQNLDSDLMGSFRYQTHSAKRWWIWFFSVAAGIVNVLSLVTLNLFLVGG